jgi:hypothetical protein
MSTDRRPLAECHGEPVDLSGIPGGLVEALFEAAANHPDNGVITTGGPP